MNNPGGKIVIIFASTVREAKEFAAKDNQNLVYITPYKYSKGKGNNFYEFNEQPKTKK